MILEEIKTKVCEDCPHFLHKQEKTRQENLEHFEFLLNKKIEEYEYLKKRLKKLMKETSVGTDKPLAKQKKVML